MIHCKASDTYNPKMLQLGLDASACFVRGYANKSDWGSILQVISSSNKFILVSHAHV